jgi:benzoylformate decarboxylase
VKASEEFARLLDGHGVHEIFGNPGTTELPFLEGIRQRYYLTLHDSIALGAADGAAQVSRGIAVANLHAAPGLGNSIGFLDSARRNRSPVLVTVGQQDLRHADQNPLLYGDFGLMARGLVKYYHEVTRVEELAETLERAVRTALAPPMGPVLLSLPMNVMEGPAGAAPATVQAATPSAPADPRQLIERVRAATHPAIVVGYEVDVYDAFSEVAELARRLGAPVYAEPICSRSPIPEGLPSFAGDLLPQSAYIDSTLGGYDLVLLIGADLTLYPYSAAPLLSGDRLAYLGSDPSVPEKLHCDRAIGHLKQLLGTLLEGLPSSGRTFRPPPDFGRANRVARAAARMGGEYVVDAVHRAFRGYTVVDESVSLIPTMKAAGFYRGRDSYFSSRSQQLGWGLAASIGITLRQPKTVVVVGDGALQYSVQALWTLARFRIPTKVVVVNNGAYNILKSYSKANHPALANAEYLDLPGIDIEGIASGYGLEASTVEAPDRLDRALSELRDADGPGLLNVEMDRTVPDLFS